MLKWLIVLVVIGAGVFFGYPLFNEDASGECDALERGTMRLALSGDDKDKAQQTIGQLFQGFSKGDFARVAVRNEYPNAPVTAACAMLYWRAMLDPKEFRKKIEKLKE
jgi:predicted negative regulator of RcsB-dependent stress response